MQSSNPNGSCVNLVLILSWSYIFSLRLNPAVLTSSFRCWTSSSRWHPLPFFNISKLGQKLQTKFQQKLFLLKLCFLLWTARKLFWDWSEHLNSKNYCATQSKWQKSSYCCLTWYIFRRNFTLWSLTKLNQNLKQKFLEKITTKLLIIINCREINDCYWTPWIFNNKSR